MPGANDPIGQFLQWAFQQGNMGNPAMAAATSGQFGAPVQNAITGAENAVADPTAALRGQPGSTLDVSQPDDDRARMAHLLAQLQQQAATGGGPWQQALANATGEAKNSAEALGQSQQGVSRMAALRGIENAQGAADQRAAGQANILGAQAQQQATGQLAGAYGQQGLGDINQAASQAAASQGVREAGQNAIDQRNRDLINTVTGAGQAASTVARMSDGGKVPGRAEVFGDDEVNDKVPAKLSPGEIVIPRSIALRADAPEMAAEFVRQVHAQRGQRNFAPGGQIPGDDRQGLRDQNQAMTDAWGTINLTPDISRGGGQTIAPANGAPSVENGGDLAIGPYQQTRDAALANAFNLTNAAQGAGPSVAPQEMRNSTDTNLAAAMAAGGRGAGAPAAAGSALAGLGSAEQAAAGNAASTVAGETQQAQQAAMHALQQQRQQDLAMAQARQQAQWRNTMMNAGVGLQQQALLRGLLGGAGQAAVAGASLFGGKDNSQPYDSNADASRGSASDLSSGDTEFKAMGGEVGDTRAADFVAALKRRRP